MLDMHDLDQLENKGVMIKNKYDLIQNPAYFTGTDRDRLLL